MLRRMSLSFFVLLAAAAWPAETECGGLLALLGVEHIPQNVLVLIEARKAKKKEWNPLADAWRDVGTPYALARADLVDRHDKPGKQTDEDTAAEQKLVSELLQHLGLDKEISGHRLEVKFKHGVLDEIHVTLVERGGWNAGMRAGYDKPPAAIAEGLARLLALEGPPRLFITTLDFEYLPGQGVAQPQWLSYRFQNFDTGRLIEGYETDFFSEDVPVWITVAVLVSALEHGSLKWLREYEENGQRHDDAGAADLLARLKATLQRRPFQIHPNVVDWLQFRRDIYNTLQSVPAMKANLVALNGPDEVAGVDLSAVNFAKADRSVLAEIALKIQDALAHDGGRKTLVELIQHSEPNARALARGIDDALGPNRRYYYLAIVDDVKELARAGDQGAIEFLVAVKARDVSRNNPGLVLRLATQAFVDADRVSARNLLLVTDYRDLVATFLPPLLAMQDSQFIGHLESRLRDPNLNADRRDSILTQLRLIAEYKWSGRHFSAVSALVRVAESSDPDWWVSTFLGTYREELGYESLPDALKTRYDAVARKP